MAKIFTDLHQVLPIFTNHDSEEGNGFRAYAYLHICLSVCWFVNMITAECLDQESPFCHA